MAHSNTADPGSPVVNKPSPAPDLSADYYLYRPDQTERRKHQLINELAGLGVDVSTLQAA